MDIYEVFPLEIWEKIISCLDGRSLNVLSRTTLTFITIIDSLDQRHQIWERCCNEELSYEEMIDMKKKIVENVSLCQPYKYIHMLSNKWNNIKYWTFDVENLSISFVKLNNIKISGKLLLVGDKSGLTILNYITGKKKEIKIGPIRDIRIHTNLNDNLCRSVVDCTLEPEIHNFFRLPDGKRLQKDKFERKLIRYSAYGKRSEFASGLPRRLPTLEIDVSENKILMVNNKNIVQLTDSQVVISRAKIVWEGVRCWYIWHAQLVLFAKDDALEIFLNGKTKVIRFRDFPRISAIFYYNNVLFLGNIYGVLYLYRITPKDVLNLVLINYDIRRHIYTEPLVAINIIENEDGFSNIIIGTETKIFNVKQCNNFMDYK